MHETPVIFVHDLLEAAIALGLASADVAARLGVDPAVFNRAAADAKNGKNPTVSRKSEKIYSAAVSLIEEARKTRETRKEGGGQSASAGPDKLLSGGAGETSVAAAEPRFDQPQGRLPAKAGENGDPDKQHAADAGHADNQANGHADDWVDDVEDRSDSHDDADTDPGDRYYGLDAGELILAAEALAGHADLDMHARAIIRAAGPADMDEAEDDQLIDALARVWKPVGKPAIRKLLRAERDAYLGDQGGADREQPSAADILLGLVEQAGWKPWRDRRTDEAVVTIAPGQHLLARSRLMRQSLRRLWKDQRPGGRRVCPAEAIDSVIATLAAEVAVLNPTMASVVRYAASGENRMAPDGVVVDFGDDTFEALQITPAGITVIRPEAIDAAGIRFVRPMLMSELPRPREVTPQEAIDRLPS